MNALALDSIDTAPAARFNALGAYLTETRYELMRAVRNPSVAIRVLALPVGLLALFAVVIAGEAIVKDPDLGIFYSPEGNPMFMVSLFTPPPEMFDGPSISALVDPTTNTFYVSTTGGVGGIANFLSGPGELPKGSRFAGPSFTATDAQLLARAAR